MTVEFLFPIYFLIVLNAHVMEILRSIKFCGISSPYVFNNTIENIG